ncbi:hypothetical protein AFLA_008686 [Aspergillus flavus NRRL3357]|nr:hypothetical protein AFLA_008686 [Aspergillus flavus NRRL3357]
MSMEGNDGHTQTTRDRHIRVNLRPSAFDTEEILCSSRISRVFRSNLSTYHVIFCLREFFGRRHNSEPESEKFKQIRRMPATLQCLTSKLITHLGATP